MRILFLTSIVLLMLLPASAKEPLLSKEKAVKIALLVIEQPKYEKWASWYTKPHCEAPAFDEERRVWIVPNPAFVVSYAEGGPPFFEIRDSDGYYRIGPGIHREKTKFQMSPFLRKQIKALIAESAPPK